jgi:DNA recombination protein RmuC
VEILYVVAAAAGGALVGGAVLWRFASERSARGLAEVRSKSLVEVATATARLDEASRRSEQLQTALSEREASCLELRSALSSSQQKCAALVAELDAERKAAVEKETTLRDAFTSLSREALETNNRAFLDLAQTKLGEFQQAARADLEGRQKEIAGLVQPLCESLGKIGDHLQQVDRDRATTAQALTTQLQAVGETQERLRRETETLVRALKSPNQRGRWGEVQLRNIIERAGMSAYCGDFSEKEIVLEENGRRAIPDVTVRLPNGSCVVIDSKVPIDAYLNALEAEDGQKERLLRDHARQVREHIRGLSAKAYWAKFTPTPELVVMFLPAEPLFSSALQHDATLFDYAADLRVIPASPLTLLALLRTVASAWQHQRLAESAEQVRALGAELYDRVAQIADYAIAVGQSLRQAGAMYDRFIGSLESRVLVSARRFRDLGVSGTKEFPEVGPIQLEVREPNAPELRVPTQERLLEAELIEDAIAAPQGEPI